MRLPYVNLRLIAVTLGVVVVLVGGGAAWLWYQGRPDKLYQSAEEKYHEGQRLRLPDDPKKKPSDDDLEKARVAYEHGRTLVEKLLSDLSKSGSTTPDPREAQAHVLRYKILKPLSQLVDRKERKDNVPPPARNAANLEGDAFRSGQAALKVEPKNVEALAIMVFNRFRQNDFRGAYPYARDLIDNLPADTKAIDLEDFNDYVIGAYYVVALKDLENNRPEEALKNVELSVAREKPRADGRPPVERWRAVAVEVQALQKMVEQSAKQPKEAKATEDRLKALLAQSVERARSELKETVPATDDRPEMPVVAAQSLTNTNGMIEVLLASVARADSHATAVERADVLLQVCEKMAAAPKAATHVYNDAVRGSTKLSQINARMPAGNRLGPAEMAKAQERAVAVNDAVLKNGGPIDPEAYLEMSMVAQAQNDRPRALTLAQRGLQIAADQHVKADDKRLLALQKQAAWMLLLDHKVKEAEEYLALIAKQRQLASDVAYMRGLGAVLDGRLEEGVRQLTEARKAQGYRDAIPLLLGLAHAYLGQGQIDAALEPLDELYRIRKAGEVKNREDLIWINIWQPGLEHANLSLLRCCLALALRPGKPATDTRFWVEKAQKHAKELQGTFLADDATVALLNFELAKLRILAAKDPNGLEIDPQRQKIAEMMAKLPRTSRNDPRVLWTEVNIILTQRETNPAEMGAAVAATLGAPTDLGARLGEVGRYRAGSAWQWQKAEERVMQAAAEQKDSLPIQRTWVRWLLLRGRTQEALAKLTDLESKAADDKERRQLQADRARLLLLTGQKDEAGKIIDVLRKDGEDINAQMLYALEVLAGGDQKQADDILSGVLSKHDQSGLYHYYQGQKAQAKGEFAQAIQSFERSLQFTQFKAPSQVALMACLADIADGPPGKPEKANPEEAFREAKRLRAAHPSDPAILLAYATTAREMDVVYGSDGMEGALADMVKALAEDRGLAANGPYVAAQQWLAAGRPDLARQALKGNRKHLASMVLATQLAVGDEDWAEAADDLKAVAALQPDAIDLPLWRAALHEARGEVKDAKEIYTKFIDEHPKLSAGYLRMARLHENAKEYREAQGWVKKWRNQAPGEPGGLLAQVRLLAEDGQVPEALKQADAYAKEQLRKARERVEDWEAKNPITEKDKDKAKEEAERRAKAKAAQLDGLELALTLDVVNALQQGRAYAEAERLLSERALPLLDKLPEAARKGSRISFKLARASLLMEQGRQLKEKSPERAKLMDQAIQEYDEVYKEVPGHLVAGNNLAWLLVKEKNEPARALALVEKVRLGKHSQKPLSPERLPLPFLDTIGVVYRASNMNQEALNLFKETAQYRYDKEPRLLFYLALAQAGLGSKSEAHATFRKVINLADEQAHATADPERKQKLEKLIADAKDEQKKIGAVRQ